MSRYRRGRVAPSKKSRIVTIFVLVIAIVSIVTLLVAYRNHNINQSKKPNNPISLEFNRQLGSLKEKSERQPKDATAHNNYAVALYATGNVREAKNQYEEATTLDPKNATAFNNLGNAYRDLNDTSKAIESYRRAINLNPKLINPYFNLANIQQHALKDTDKAIDTYRNGLSALPNNEQLLLSLALAYEAKKDTANAEQIYRSLVALYPSNSTAKDNLNRLTK